MPPPHPLPPSAPPAAAGLRGAVACGACCRTPPKAALPRRGGAARGAGAPAYRAAHAGLSWCSRAAAPAHRAHVKNNYSWGPTGSGKGGGHRSGPCAQAAVPMSRHPMHTCLQRMRLAGSTTSSLDTRSFASSLTAGPAAAAQQLVRRASQPAALCAGGGAVQASQWAQRWRPRAAPPPPPQQPVAPLSHSGVFSDSLPCTAAGGRPCELAPGSGNRGARAAACTLNPALSSLPLCAAACWRAPAGCPHIHDLPQQRGLRLSPERRVSHLRTEQAAAAGPLRRTDMRLQMPPSHSTGTALRSQAPARACSVQGAVQVPVPCDCFF